MTCTWCGNKSKTAVCKSCKKKTESKLKKVDYVWRKSEIVVRIKN